MTLGFHRTFNFHPFYINIRPNMLIEKCYICKLLYLFLTRRLNLRQLDYVLRDMLKNNKKQWGKFKQNTFR